MMALGGWEMVLSWWDIPLVAPFCSFSGLCDGSYDEKMWELKRKVVCFSYRYYSWSGFGGNEWVFGIGVDPRFLNFFFCGTYVGLLGNFEQRSVLMMIYKVCRSRNIHSYTFNACTALWRKEGPLFSATPHRSVKNFNLEYYGTMKWAGLF